MFIGAIACWLISGMLAWNWVEPAGFGGAILFLIVWGALGKLFSFVGSLAILAIERFLK